MEALGAATSILAVVQVAAEVAKLCGGYIGEVKDAVEDIKRMEVKISILHNVLQKLEASPSLQDHQTVMKQCYTDLKAIQDKLSPSKTRGIMKRVGLHALKWPFSKKEVDQKVAVMDGYLHEFNTILQVDLNTRFIDSEEERCLETKFTYVAGASLSEQQHRHRSCLPNTRVAVLREIEHWAGAPSSQCMFWVRGMAGTGKSTVAISVAERLRSYSPSVATFFFRRGFGDLGNARKLLPTLVRQLAYTSAPYRSLVVAATKAEPDLGRSANLRNQYEKFIVNPLATLHSATTKLPLFYLVIDALDECGQEQRSSVLSDLELLLHLFATTKGMSKLGLRVVVTSRPEFAIEKGFEAMPGIMYRDLDLYHRPRQEVDEDIATFIKHELERVRLARDITPPWPSGLDVAALVGKAAGLFIFADTACRYIAGPSQADSHERLVQVCSLSATTHFDTELLDQMYTTVLKNAFTGKYSPQEQKRISLRYERVVGSIILVFAPLPMAELHRLLECHELGTPDHIMGTLRDLHAVIDVPRDELSSVEPLHLSFRDFLLDAQRCIHGPFRIEEKQTHQHLASNCLRLLSYALHRNICKLTTSSITVNEIEQADIDHALPAAVKYSCQYWEAHVHESEAGSVMLVDGGSVHTFLESHFLHWLEAMSLLGRISDAVLAMTDLRNLVNPRQAPKLFEVVNDFHRFLLAFRRVISTLPIQIYNSALFFSPLQSVVRCTFQQDLLKTFALNPPPAEKWNTCLQTLEGHSHSVSTVVFSPDSKLVASGSRDNTVRLWDVTKGESVAELTGHSDIISTVVFSPDGKLMASGSDDKTVRLWDVAKGESVAELTGHSDVIRTVVFSPDGKLVASGSYDKTVRLWDVTKGESVAELTGHSHFINTVVFSPDGKLVASGSYDKTVQLWDVAKGESVAELTGHSDIISTVVFSPDGKLVASGSDDKTVRLWDVAKGESVAELTGHSDWVSTVVFSSDGKLMASGSYDKTVRLWDVAKGESVAELTGHSDWVSTVVFSPDGKLVASGSRDNRVRLWDVAKGESVAELTGHSDWVSTVVFSLDGKLVASGSNDKTVRLWDMTKGESVAELTGHSHFISTVVFSPDGKLVASGSYDNTVRLWDVAKGESVAELTGHSDIISTVVFSPDGKLMASGSDDKTVRLWDVAKGESVAELTGHSDVIRTVVFSPDGKLVASGSYDNTVRTHQIRDGTLLSTIAVRAVPKDVSILQNSHHIVINGQKFNMHTGERLSHSPPQSGPTAGILRSSGEWITRASEKALWLPPEYRTHVQASHENTITLGLSNGSIRLLSWTPISSEVMGRSSCP